MCLVLIPLFFILSKIYRPLEVQSYQESSSRPATGFGRGKRHTNTFGMMS